MCGISGLVLRSNEKVEKAQLRQMAEAMVRRGPDAEGIFARQNVGLAHRRLKIIDLSDSANQPLFIEEGNIGIVFNGEIYNFRELRRELEKDGAVFKTQSDTEVILHAFQKWGTDSFLKLNGMFAFAILDLREKDEVLHLVRDRFGIKPLFYSFEFGRLVFASELKPLMHIPWIRKEIDKVTLFHFLKFSHVPNPLSIFKDVSQLKPGHFLTLKKGVVKENPYWDPVQTSFSWAKKSGSIRSGKIISEKQALYGLEEKLKAAVERQLVSDVPVGCFLSGGIDSSLLVMAASELGRIKTFSIGYKEAEFNEAPFAKQIAKRFGTDHHEWIASPSDFFEIIPDVPTYFDQPFADPTLLSSLLLSRFAREHVTVALSGDGGDELFFGYPHQLAMMALSPLAMVPSMIRQSGFGAFGNLLSQLSPVIAGPVAKWSQRLKKLTDILQFQNRAELYQSFIGTLGPLKLNDLSHLLSDFKAPKKPFFNPLISDLDALSLPLDEKISQVFIRTFLVDTVLAKTDRAGMAFGLEARVPFLDDELVEYSSLLKFGFKFSRGRSKYLLRKLLSTKLRDKTLGESIAKRRKQGFSIPLRDWLRGDLKYLLDEYLNPIRLGREGFFAAKEVDTLVKQHVNRQANHSHLLWSMICFQLWKERFQL